jgi:hypothetical protein
MIGDKQTAISTQQSAQLKPIETDWAKGQGPKAKSQKQNVKNQEPVANCQLPSVIYEH